MILTLTITKGEDAGAVFQLREGDTKTLGRGSRCDITLRDATISRHHAQLRMLSSACYVQDAGSRNGTLVNGRPIEGEVRLADRDALHFGQVRVEIRIQPETAELPFEAPPLGSQVNPPGHDDVTLDAPASAVPRMMLRGEPAELIGSVIGGCRIERLLATEGPCHIYRALQVSMERAVALKVLPPENQTDQPVVEWFVNAARLGGRLSHPNVIQVYDAGQEHGLYFITLEYVGNATLRDYLGREGNERPLDQAQAAGIAEQLAGGLDYIHSQGTAHGRVTPEHIMLTSHGIPKLNDLGFVGSGPSLWVKPSLNELSHTAPELLNMGAQPTAPADIYSLGAVLFTMLAGRPAVHGNSAAEVVKNVKTGSLESLLRLRKDINRPLAQVVEKATALMPAERFGRAAELQAALRKAMERL